MKITAFNNNLILHWCHISSTIRHFVDNHFAVVSPEMLAASVSFGVHARTVCLSPAFSNGNDLFGSRWQSVTIYDSQHLRKLCIYINAVIVIDLASIDFFCHDFSKLKDNDMDATDCRTNFFLFAWVKRLRNDKSSLERA